MADRYSQLLNHCAELLKMFDQEMQSMEDHMESYLRHHKIEDVDDTFIKEVFSGCIRHSGILKVVTEGFFASDGKRILRSSESELLVLAYLALFRLDELGMTHFRKFASLLNRNTAYKLFNFLFDETNLMTWMKDEWNKVYDSSYVQTHLLSPILRWLPELRDLVQILKNRADSKQEPKPITSITTETRPFNLTKPRARVIPVPEQIPMLTKSKPPPKSLYKPPAIKNAIQIQKEENKRKAEEHLLKASKLQFSCANPEKSERTKNIIQNIINEEESKMDTQGIKARPAPEFKRDHLPVKMTSAAILREGLLYQKQENDIIEKLRKLEAGAHDASDFYKWQTEKRQQDLEKELAACEERRLKGKLSHEEAILARANLIAENQSKAQSMKKEAADKMREYLKQKSEMEKEMKMLVESTMAGHKMAKDAKKHIQEYKQKIVQEVKEENSDMMKLALAEAEEELRCKMKLIQEIRAMESTPTRNAKMVDLTSTSGFGLLGEMSIAELRERLALLKAKNKEDQEMKRDSIITIKQNKAEHISEMMDLITKFRTEQTKSAACKLEMKNLNTAAPLKNENVIELERKIREKREERLREQQKLQPLFSHTSGRRNRAEISQKAWNKLCNHEGQKMKPEETRLRKMLDEAQSRAARLLSEALSDEHLRQTSAVS
ncbi:hypothetical protein BsWGS_04855 [Bradybaena similaris]